MSIQEMAITSIRWATEFSTCIFIRAKNKLFACEFIQRNKKRIVLGLLIWLLSIFTGYCLFQSAVGQVKKEYYQSGLSAIRNLASNTVRLVLAKDLLALSVEVEKVTDNTGLAFAAIVDHEKKILAHTDSTLINKPFTPLNQIKYIDGFGKVTVEEGYLSKKKVTNFSLDLIFAKTKIGKVYFALLASQFYGPVNKYRKFFIFWVFFSIFLLFTTLLFIDQVSMVRALKRQKELEGITRLGPYILQKKIASGGMAELFMADYIREDDFRRTLAVKKVLPHLAQKPEFTKMFIREAKVAALLQHPNIVQVFDFGKFHDVYFIAMEYVDGKNLAEIMIAMKKGLALDQAIFFISKVCLGLQYSHSRKDDKTGKPLSIVHRDISPQNIMISFKGEVKISDFGISKSNSEPSLTQTGEIKGKFSYFSPEQALGKPIDYQTDIFATGIIFYELLSGERLYKFKSPLEALKAIPKERIVPIKELRPDVPIELNDIVMRCLKKDKKLRYQRAQDIHDDLLCLKKSLNMTYDEINLTEFMGKLFP